MPYYVSFRTSAGQNFGKGRVYALKQGVKALTPRNLSYAIESPRAIVVGPASGRGSYGSITITKEIDNSSPQLHHAVGQGQGIHEVHIDIFRGDPGGITRPLARPHFTISLTGASLVRCTRKPIPSVHIPGHMQGGSGDMEEVEFTFQKITWTSTTGHATTEDNWTSAA